MSRVFRSLWSSCFLILILVIAGSGAHGQVASDSRITQPIDNQQRIALKGNVHRLAQPRYDQGAVADSFSAERMLLLLKRSPESDSALLEFLQAVHNPGSSSYHKWLTPEQFGKLYGPADVDVTTVVTWLRSYGFTVARVTKGKTAIEFSGSAGQIRQAFHTEIHTYVVQGKEHHANNRDPQIPAALAPVVAGITPMNDFAPSSYALVLGQAGYDAKTHQVTPQWTLGSEQLAVAPGDFAVQYDLNPVYAAGTNGAGVTIGIIGDSNVDPTLVAAYRSLFGLPASPLNVVIDGSDPGQNGAAIESYLDVEASGAVAPGANINLYTAAATAVQDGLYLAATRAVDDDEASVLSTSYGTCEQDLGSAGNQFWAAVWEQAAAQGQTSLVSAGDGGSAGCDNFDGSRAAVDGLAVSGITSTPWNISVGGTDFYYSSYNGTSAAQNTQLGTYWNLTSSGLPVTSILTPIPEQPWNNAFGLNLYDGGDLGAEIPTIVAGSGGVSSCSSGTEAADGTYATCTGGYSKPAWQTGAGVPSDSVRDIPDVSLFAANGDNYSFYPICANSGECVSSNGYVNIAGVGGTSASSPSMAGILALINQKYGRQGQANFKLYPLATQHPVAFHDIALGGNNVPCTQGSPNCTLSTLGDNTKGYYTLGKYYAGAGYDLATGLGSIDANLLLTYWNSLSFAPTTTTLTANPASVVHGTPITVKVGVTGSGGTPSGSVALITTATPSVNTGAGDLTLLNGAATSNVNSLPGGTYQLTARYGGDGTFAPSNSSPVTLDVTPEASTTTLSGAYINYSTNMPGTLLNGGTYPYGYNTTIDALATGVNAPHGSTDGVATGTVVITDSASTGTSSTGSISLGSVSVATWNTTGIAVGSHSLVARYSGDVSFNSSTSAPLTFTITKAVPTSLVLATPTPVALGASATLSLLVGIPSNALPPTGTVTFYSGKTVLGSTNSLIPCLSLPPSTPIFCYLSGDAVASINVTSLPLGTDTVNASYSGDANYEAVTSTPISVLVEPNANLTAVGNPNPVNQLQSTVVTATVTGVKGMPAPTGTVFMQTSNYSCGSNPPLTNGTTSCTFQANLLALGTDSVSATYSGDAIYAPSQVTVPITVTAPFAVAGTSVAIADPGATTSNTSTITVTPMSGFMGAVSLSCVLTSSPAGASYAPGCSIPSSVNIANANPATAAMTITSTANSSALVAPSPNRVRWLVVNGAAALACILLFGVPARGRGWRSLLSLLFVFAALGGLAGCGGGSNGGGSGVTGTTPGSYTFTVTATSQGVSEKGTVTVTFQ